MLDDAAATGVIRQIADTPFFALVHSTTVSAAGLLPIMRLAEKAGLRSLADQWLSVPTDKGANAGTKVESLVAGMVAGADSIDDMALLRHGGMSKLFTACYAPSTLGSFLRSFPSVMFANSMPSRAGSW